jgi:predicted ribonuclease toxin of YeeF-YezG toxin-antitoxin module
MGKKTQNGLYLFDQYQMEKYEKIEFDMNTIDSALWKKAIQRNGIYFDHVDTSR